MKCKRCKYNIAESGYEHCQMCMDEMREESRAGWGVMNHRGYVGTRRRWWN